MKIFNLLPIIGLAILVYLLVNIDVYKVVENIAGINPLYFLLSLPLFAFIFVIKAFKWRMIVKTYNISFSLIDAFKAWLVGFSLSIITPGKVGDFARAYYLKDKTKVGKSVTTVMADRLTDIAVLFVLAIIGLFAFVVYYVNDQFLLVSTTALFILFLAAVFVLSRKNMATRILKPFYRRLLPSGYKSRAKNFYDDFYEGVDVMLKRKSIIILSVLLTFLIWLLSIFYVFVLSMAFDMNLSYWFLLMIMPLVSLLLILPISFGGIGTREASIVFFLSFVGVSAELAFSFSITMLILDYIIGVAGFALWYRNPIKFRENKPI